MRLILMKNVGIPIDEPLCTHVVFLMGCTPSSQTKREKLIGTDTNIMEAYIKLEREIWQEEQQAPAPALTHAISKLEKITSDLEKLASEITQNQNFTFNQVPSKPDNIETENLESIDNSIKNAMTELRVMNNPKVATEHEEFIANLNRKSLKCRQLYLLNRRKLEIEEEAAKLSDKVQNLQKLYEQQDTILSEVIGSSYASEIESELNRLRNYRDALYSSELAWQDTIKLTESASVFSQAGLSSWQTINNITSNEESRFRLATETRNTIHEAALLIQSAQSMLPTVQFPYCTSREIFAILQVIEYLYTDMQITERYDHAREVYKSFQRRTLALSKWLKELMTNTIHKDILEVDKKIAEFVSRLSTERIQQIKKKTATIGLSNGILTAESLESLDSVHQKHFVRK
ncbi:uncharacterized protein LOC135849390 [Planococcus citri]|uniref:uncharacterized protein LOC135849390 n=1 Tax=Planococcus citri TaxID=170843 RepID=UPI0031F831B7